MLLRRFLLNHDYNEVCRPRSPGSVLLVDAARQQPLPLRVLDFRGRGPAALPRTRTGRPPGDERAHAARRLGRRTYTTYTSLHTHTVVHTVCTVHTASHLYTPCVQ